MCGSDAAFQHHNKIIQLKGKLLKQWMQLIN